MEVDLEAAQTQKTHRLSCIFYRMAAPVEVQDSVVEALHAQLHFGDAQATQAHDLARGDPIGARLDDEADVVVGGVCVLGQRLIEGERLAREALRKKSIEREQQLRAALESARLRAAQSVEGLSP